MSKSSTTSTNKSLPAKSAWSKGPPQTSAPSPRSQSPAPSAQQPSHLTHSRRPSALGQAVPLKDGVSIPRNIGAAAAKQGSAVTFGSIDDASAPISSSPAAAPAIKESVVKSFGTVPAASNGKASVTRPSVSTASPSTTAAPSPSTTTPQSSAPGPAKLDRRDIAKLFQGSPAPSAPSPADTQSPSVRTANLPPQNQPPQTPSSASQPSQFGSHFTPFVPGRQPQNSGPSNGPNRSPVYSRQMPNGAGPRPPAPPNGAPSTGMSSPRLQPPHVAQQTGPPATSQGPGQPPHMGPPPQMVWNGGYYYPDPYAGYAPWGYVQPGMPPQQHPPHMAPPPHMPPHPMSPHTPSRPLQPSTPTMSHAAPNPIHPSHPPPPPLAHANSGMSNITSPPPTPSSARLNPGSSAFVPSTRKITLKNPEGKEVQLESLTKATAAATTAATTISSGQSTPFRGSSPGTPKRSSIRIESEDQRRKRLEEEEKKLRTEQDAEKAKKEKEEAERKKKEEEEKKEQERIKAEEEKKEQERLRKEEEERKQKEEEERRKKEEEEEKERLKRQEEEERLRREAEEAERARKEAEEKERLRKEEEEKKAKEEAERKIQEEEEKKKRQEEEAKQRAEAEAKAKAESAAAAAAAEPGPKEEGEITETPSKEKVKEGLRINTATSNAADLGKRRPANLDLSGTKGAPIASALATARSLDTLEGLKYPEGINSPKAELNEHAKPGRFRYDRDFLLQFKEICKDRPPNLPPLDAIGLEPIDQAALMMSRGGSGRRGASGPVPTRQASMGTPFGAPSSLGKSGSPFSMGNFTAPRMSSEDRFNMSNGNRVASAGNAPGAAFRGPGPVPISRTGSQGGRDRTRSKRGDKRPPAEGGKGQDRGSSFAQNQQLQNLEPVAPLQVSANRWDRKSLAADPESPEVVERKVKGLLNKLTMEKFDSISDQIIAWANKSEKEKDGRTLIQVIRLVFEKATDEANWSEMYARLCRKMMEQISPKVQDESIKNAEGKPIAGGQLFRKYLLNRCQEDFERGWAAKDATAAAAAAKAADDEAVKVSNVDKKEEEVELYSDEYYAAAKAKRQGLGLIKFIGELFKLQMLTERIMHECVKKLLGNVENPEEEEIESLCKLLTTVGKLLDTPKAQGHMDIYFSRMQELTKSNKVSQRMHFMLQDVIETRARGWVSRTAVAAPTTIAQVHENALKEKAAQDRENAQRQSQISMSRTNSNRGRGRNDTEPDGWAVAGNTRPVSVKAGDLSNFGKISKGQPISFGPSSVFSKGAKAEKRESISRTASSSNMFSMLQNDAASEPKPEPQQRKKLALLPRSVPRAGEDASSTGPADEEGSGEEEEAPKAAPDMSEADAKKKIDEDCKELFAVRNIDESENYFTALPAQYHQKLVDKLVSTAIESKSADAELVASVFERASTKQLSSPSAFEEGLAGIAEFLEDIAIDAPHAYQLYATMAKGAKLSADAHSRLAEKDTGSKLLPLLS